MSKQNKTLQDLINEQFVGKVVATRGIGSGVNVGTCVAIDNDNILLEGSYFLRSWEYDNSKSHGAFHSLSSACIKDSGGEITKTKNDTIITDVAQVVVCDDKILKILDKVAK